MMQPTTQQAADATPDRSARDAASKAGQPVVPRMYLFPFILTTSCFALWGFANDLTNPMVKVFKEIFVISNMQSALVQLAFYGGYFTMAIPAAIFIGRYSYKSAILVGFVLYALGAALSIPASLYMSFSIFLLGFYILTFGLAFLETSCNPYILAMGPASTATQRLNLAQSFNPIGSLLGMTVASVFIAPSLMVGELRQKVFDNDPRVVEFLDDKDFADGVPIFRDELPGVLDGAVPQVLTAMRIEDPDQFRAIQSHDLAVVRTPYVVISLIVIAMLIVFALTRMPRFDTSGNDRSLRSVFGELRHHPDYVQGVVAQAFYVGAQITCWTFIIHYAMEQVGLSLAEAQNWNIAAMILFLCSRFVCTFLLKFVSPGALLCCLAIIAAVFTGGGIYLPGQSGLVCIVAISGCMSLMFPTIYGIALKGLSPEQAKFGSAGLVMAIVGGAILPLLQGRFIDTLGVRNSFFLPLFCFLVVAIYGFLAHRRNHRSGSVIASS